MSDENEAMFPVVIPVSFSRFTRPLLNGTVIDDKDTESSSNRFEMLGVAEEGKQLLPSMKHERNISLNPLKRFTGELLLCQEP